MSCLENLRERADTERLRNLLTSREVTELITLGHPCTKTVLADAETRLGKSAHFEKTGFRWSEAGWHGVLAGLVFPAFVSYFADSFICCNCERLRQF